MPPPIAANRRGRHRRRAGAAVLLALGGWLGFDAGQAGTASAASMTRDRATAHAAAGEPLRCTIRRRRYRTLPDVRPAPFCVAGHPAATAPGHVLVTPRSVGVPRREQNAAMIVSSEGRILWYEPRPYRVHDLKTVTYRGQPALAFYQRMPGRGSYYELRDRRYRELRRITMGAPYGTDMHELQLTPAGTAYVGSFEPYRHPDGPLVTQYVIREIDLETNAVLFEWQSLAHVPVYASYMNPPVDGSVWDYFHGNSIEPPVDGDPTIIVSARNTSAIYGIDRATGAVRWTLGGRHDQFGLGATGQQFCTQHDARRLPNGDILVFDNGGSGRTANTGCPLHPAQVLRLRLDLSTMSASTVGVLPSRLFAGTGQDLFPIALGSARPLPTGGVLVSWGTKGRITEVTPDGRAVWGLRLSGSTYRAVRSEWVGTPAGRPRIMARRRAGAVEIWASWNGATEIAHWRVLAGDDPARLAEVGPAVPFADLETHLQAVTPARYVAVRALDLDRRELGRSRAVRLPPPARRPQGANRSTRQRPEDSRE